MNTETQKAQRLIFITLAIAFATTLLVIFRFTAAAVFIVFILVCVFSRLRCGRRVVQVALPLFVATILIPVDVYVPRWYGPLINSKHTGLRLIEVSYGLTSGPLNGSEEIEGGCIVGLYDTHWVIVWD